MYEYLMAKADEATRKAHFYFQQKEMNLFTFYANAAQGFKDKALSLPLPIKK